jgi:hypothetical protein
MTFYRLTSIVTLVIGATIAADGRAQAQYFPDDKLTKGMQRHFDSVASKYGAAFVSGCVGPEDGEMAILVIPVGADSGTISLILSGKVYNGAGVQLRAGKAIVTEGGGGQWSMSKLQFYADTLTQVTFRLESRERLRAVLTSQPTSRCPKYAGD